MGIKNGMGRNGDGKERGAGLEAARAAGREQQPPAQQKEINTLSQP